jgi:NAD(P)H dehydrogenase (quinone)
MTMILVTGASGALGTAVVTQLARTQDALAGSRTPARIQPGVPRRRVDFDDPTTLPDALRDIDTLVLISAGYAEDDVVMARHDAAIDAAAAAGVRHVIYTSLYAAGERLTIALAHRWTEAALAAAPLDVTVLRNGLYAEVPVALALLAASGEDPHEFTAPWGDGRASVVTRDDLADAAARIASEVQADIDAGGSSRHADRTYELSGTVALGGSEIATALSEALQRPVAYRPTALADAWGALAANGLPPYQVAHAVSIFSNIAAGQLEQRRTDLPALLNTEPRPVLDLILETMQARAAGRRGHEAVPAIGRVRSGARQPRPRRTTE